MTDCTDFYWYSNRTWLSDGLHGFLLGIKQNVANVGLQGLVLGPKQNVPH